MNWAQRRKFLYIATVLLLLGGFGFLLFRHFTNVVPTCFDNKKNGTETGVDCGGACQLYCVNDLSNPRVRWVRTFQMTSTMTHAVAYIEHNNATAGVQTLPYTFRFYDAQNNILLERSGTTFLGPLGRTAIVESLVPLAAGSVARTSISFAEPIVWKRISSAFSAVVIKTDKTLLERYTYGSSVQNGTRLTAAIENTSRYEFTDMDVVAILYDKDDNVITAAKLLIPSLPALGSQTLTFTWPFTLPVPAVRIEIIPRINPFAAKFI